MQPAFTRRNRVRYLGGGLRVAGATGQRRRLLSARVPVRVWGDARLVRVTGHPAAFSARKLRVRAPHELPCRCHPDGTGSRTFNPAVARSIRVSGTAEGVRSTTRAHNPGKRRFKSGLRYQSCVAQVGSSARPLTGRLQVRGLPQEPWRISTTGQCTTPSRWRVPVRIRYASPSPRSSAVEHRRDKAEGHVRLVPRVPRSHGETEIMTDYESVVGGSSPPGSTSSAISSAAERLPHTQLAGGSSPPSCTVIERRSDESGCDPGRRGGSTLRSPQASLAERTIAPGCKPGSTDTVVRIHHGARSHGPEDRTPPSGGGSAGSNPAGSTAGS
jgi:hypothetical protein